MFLLRQFSLHFVLVYICIYCITLSHQQDTLPLCNNLQHKQYSCKNPPIDQNTFQLSGCTPNRTVEVTCTVVPGVDCVGDMNWTMQVDCIYTNGYNWHTTMGLSIFLGPFGIDRFYLGYPLIGLIKLFTFGGFLFGNWIDFIMISTQTLKPADGSDYIIKINGPRVIRATPEYIAPLSNLTN